MINRTNEARTALQGKVTMVTRANAGMGKEIARALATNSSKVSYDESIARRLWQISAELTQLPTDLQSSR